MIFDFRAKCPECQAERILLGPWEAYSEAEMDLLELSIPKSTEAKCPACGRVEMVAMFVDGEQDGDWQDADAFERDNGPSAGPLPRKPWFEVN